MAWRKRCGLGDRTKILSEFRNFLGERISRRNGVFQRRIFGREDLEEERNFSEEWNFSEEQIFFGGTEFSKTRVTFLFLLSFPPFLTCQ
jgi:hypothetical protein